MFSTWRERVHAVAAAACALAVIVVGGMLHADEQEFPGDPLIGSSITLPIGEITVEAEDLGGSVVDAKDTLEPQLTAMMLTTDVSVSPDQTLGVQTSPTFETWTQ